MSKKKKILNVPMRVPPPATVVRKTAIKQLAMAYRQRARLAATQAVVMGMQATLAEMIEENGASIESVSQKLGWDDDRLLRLLTDDDDLDMRVVSDVMTACGKQLDLKVSPWNAAPAMLPSGSP